MPLPVISIAQMREWEKATWATGQTEAEVIRRVGQVVAAHALRQTRTGDRIVILAGKGNNGADARAAREHLTDRRVDLLEVKDSPDLSKLQALLSLTDGVESQTWGRRHPAGKSPSKVNQRQQDAGAPRPALIIDGLFGIGINRPLDADWVRFIEEINAADLAVLAVDVPSGINGDSGEPQGAAVRAVETLTVGAPKQGLLRPAASEFVGRLEVAVEVGLIPCTLPSELHWTLADDFRGFPPRRAPATHKGTYGHVAIVAGSLGYHGASVLAARAAQRAQPGLITLLTNEKVYQPVAAQLQAVMVSIWKDPPKLPESHSAILIGPGLAADDLPRTIKEWTRAQWKTSRVPVIVDASALDWLEADSTPAAGIRVLTPHPGEAARLLGCSSAEVQADRVKALRELSRRFGGAWIALKGHQTLVGRDTGEVYVNSSGNPYLAQGGSGDVLGGYVAGLLAQPGLQGDALKTIRFAVWRHGAAADWLQADRRNWTVEELVAELGRT